MKKYLMGENNMKIAVFHNLPSGGAKRALYGNIKYLTRDNEVDAFVPSSANEDYLPLEDIVNDLKIFPVKNNILSFLYSSINYFPSPTSLLELKKTQKIIGNEINKQDYDVVIVEQDKFVMAPFFLKYIKKPTVYFCQQPNCYRYNISRKLYKEAGLEYKNILHGMYLRLFGSKLIRHDKEYSRYSKYMVCNSNFSKELILKSYNIEPHVSCLGVDTELFKPLDVQKENFVLSVGQCIPEKGFSFIINSLANIPAEVRPDLVLVTDQGNIHWKNYLQKLAQEMKVKLKIMHLVSDEELVLLYNKSKLLVYTPYMEPFGLVPLESMSCGTPVVAVREGGVSETVINGKTGILTERDVMIFANEVKTLLNDKERILKMGVESIKIANNFWTLENSGKRLFDHLNRAINLYKE
jgi:glycosyltransferase involved in cell wall biosynthesis